MSNFSRPDNPASPSDAGVQQEQNVTENGDIEDESCLGNIESLVKGIEEIQDHCLNQHELHLDYRADLVEFEEKIEKICQSIKSYKIKNEETEYHLQKLKCQLQQQKTTIARESGLCLAAEEKREIFQRQIDDMKQEFIKILEEHEKKMSTFSEKLRNGPKAFGGEKLKEQAEQEMQEVEEFNAKNAELSADLQEVDQAEAELKADNDDLTALEEVTSQLEQDFEQLKEEIKKNEMELEEIQKTLAEKLTLKQNLKDEIQAKENSNSK